MSSDQYLKSMIHLTLLHTNDLHGRVTQLLHIATLVRQIRAEVKTNGGYCLYLDAGDSEDTSLLESSLTKGSAMEAILRGAGCDYVALGNAILARYGPQAIINLAKYFGRPLLCANIFSHDGKLLEGLQEYVIETVGGIKISIIGLTDPIKTYEVVFHLLTKKPIDLLPDKIGDLRSQGAQMIILLSHLGFKDDQKVAEEIAGIDVIIGGHSHTKLDQALLLKDTIIVQAGEFGQFLGRLDLEVDPVSGKITLFKEELIPITDDIPSDPEAQAAVHIQKERVDETMRLEIGTLREQIDLVSDCECAAGNLLADALLERTQGAQIALVLAGHWNTGLDSGSLTQGALYSANRSTANPAKVELSGEQIETFLREALKVENAARQIGPLRGNPVGMPHVAGMRVRYDPEDLTLLEIIVGEEPLQKDRKYIVASTDMEFSNYVNYLVIPDEQVDYEVPTIMPEVLEDYIARHSPLAMPTGQRFIRRQS